MIKVFGRVKSRTFRVVWLLEELELPYELNEIAPRSEEARSIYKNGKIPFIFDKSDLVTDSVAILIYLSDKHSAFTEAVGTKERANQDSMIFRILDEFESLLWVTAKHSYVFSEEKRVPAVLDILKWEFAKNQEKFLNEFSLRNFVCNDKFSITDILLTHCLDWAEAMELTICEEFIEYKERIMERPAYRKTISLR